MKKTSFILISLLLLAMNVSAEKTYREIMVEKINEMDSLFIVANANELHRLANTFEMISQKEETEWLPSYYAALCYVISNYFIESNKQKDALIDKAEMLIDEAATRCKSENDEILLLKAYIIQARSNVKPASRARKYYPVVEELLQKVHALNANNPRYYYMRGENLYYTPKAFGGGKDKALPLFEEAKLKYEAFSPLSTIHPTWGMDNTLRLLANCKEQN